MAVVVRPFVVVVVAVEVLLEVDAVGIGLDPCVMNSPSMGGGNWDGGGERRGYDTVVVVLVVRSLLV